MHTGPRTVCKNNLSSVSCCFQLKLLNSRGGASAFLFFCTRAMVLLEKFVGVFRDAGMDGLLHILSTSTQVALNLVFSKIIEHILCSIVQLHEWKNIIWAVEFATRVNLVFSAENEALSATLDRLFLHTVRGPTCIELVFY